MADTGFMQINDIVLDISPEQIHIDTKSVNHQYQTLRTSSSIKVKSGYSDISIVCKCVFTDDNNGYYKLRDLVSQFRVTPFCYVENAYLRNAILGGDTKQSMALALRNMHIQKDAGQDTNVINVTLVFSWFNYFPFTRNFSFKKDIFLPEEVKDPRDSFAWKRMYTAEQIRNNYQKISVLLPGDKAPTTASFQQFSQIPISKYGNDRYKKLQQRLSSLEQLRQDLHDFAKRDNNSTMHSSEFQRRLIDKIGQDNADLIDNDILRSGSSMTPNDLQQVLYLLDNKIENFVDAPSYKDELGNEWSPVVTTKGLVKIPDKISATKSSETRSNTIALSRNKTLKFEEGGLIITGISISFENILATQTLVGHPYPSYQHMGSMDAVVTLSVMTTHEESIQAISNFYNVVKDQAFKYRIIPQGQRSIRISNQLINMCGFHDFIINGLTIDTVPGQPGTYSASIQLLDNPITAQTRESFKQVNVFTSKDIRGSIANILGQNLKLRDNVFQPLGINNKPGKILIPVKHETSIEQAGNYQNEAIFTKQPAGYYTYKPRGNFDSNTRDLAFRELCIEYGSRLGKLWEKLVSVIQEKVTRDAQVYQSTGYQIPGAEMGIPLIPELYSLKDSDVPGIEKIQEDLLTVLQYHKKRGNDLIPNDINNINKLRRTAKEVINTNNQEMTTLFNEAEQAQKEGANKENTLYLQEGYIQSLGRVSNFINEYLKEWHNFVISFLDKIIKGGLIQLPQFDQARQLMESSFQEQSDNAYPDFPLKQVLQTIEGTKAAHQLRNIIDRKNILENGQSPDVLISPDFYFYNHQNDSGRQIIPNDLINKAVQSIKKSQSEQREEAETSWFQQVYDGSILGPTKAERVYKDITDEGIDPEFWNQATNSVQQALRIRMNNDTIFAPDDLRSGDPIPCSIAGTEESGEKIQLVAITDDSDIQNYINNRRDNLLLIPPANYAECQHRLGLEAIEFLGEQAYTPAPIPDTTKIPNFIWPTPKPIKYGGSEFIITSDFGFRNSPFSGKRQFHNGIDLAARSKDLESARAKTRKTPVQAIANATVADITDVRDIAKANKKGVHIKLKHASGWSSYYQHLKLDDPVTQQLSHLFHVSGNRENIFIEQGDVIGTIGNTGPSVGPHLHFEILYNNQRQDPERVLSGALNKSQKLPSFINPTNESLLTKSVEQFEKNLMTNQGYGMNRAYPTYRLYFIENDMGERKRYMFDDFFSYSSVNEIRIIRSRKLPADLCTIQLTNISGVLSNRKFRNEVDPLKPRGTDNNILEEDPNDLTITNTRDENPLASLMLQEGVQIQLRLGYSSNTNDLERIFNGVIVDVGFSENDDLVEIVCQSFGLELAQTTHGESKSFGGFLSDTGRTGEILEELMASPELVHFGRWEGGPANQSLRHILTHRWEPTPQPQDDNIFAPTGRGWKGIWDSTPKYIMYETTIWDVFQEMCLRHPSYVAYPVPYEGKFGPRMTMFFGVPDQMYFARDPSFKEENNLELMKQYANEAIENVKHDRSIIEKIQSKDPPSAAEWDRAVELSDSEIDKARDFFLDRATKRYALDKGVIKPFRNYHLLTSTLNILQNSIKSSSHGTFNTATIQYGEKSASADEETRRIKFDDPDTFTLKCDAALPDEDVREVFAQYPNCVGYEMAKRYSIGTLFNSLKEGYRGGIKVLGDPTISPFDICYILDEYTDMVGPIEVEQVVHVISHKTGFTTEITPDMVIHVNQASTLSTSDCMGLIAEYAIKSTGIQSLPSIVANGSVSTKVGAAIAGIGAANILIPSLGIAGGLIATDWAFSPIANSLFNTSENALSQGGSSLYGLVGGFIFRKLITRSQLANPFRYSPLVYHGQPMLGGLPIRKTSGSFIQGIETWFKEASEGTKLLLSDTYDRMHPNNWFGHWQGSLLQSIKGEE